MTRLCVLPLLAAAMVVAARAQGTANPFAGRWDVTITPVAGVPYPDWMELVERNGTLQARIQPRGGAVHPAVSARMDGNRLIIIVNAAAGNRPEVTWELTASGDRISGVQKRGDNADRIAGVRAPALNRPLPGKWTGPEPLFNGEDLTGWEPVNNPSNSRWAAKNGELVNEGHGSNLRTTRKFDDFQLHIEFNLPENSNSGVYLRGRYEIQLGDEGGRESIHEMGSIYGFYRPEVDMPFHLNEWQSYDITLVGRTVTILRNGITIHDHREIPGITGGALDANEGESGPIFLQGDHVGVLRFRNITISTPAP